MKENSWLTITAGQGPKECGWVVAQVCMKIEQDAIKQALSVDIVECLAFEKRLKSQGLVKPDSFRSVLIKLSGKGAENFVSDWEGEIKWQGESLYRPKHKRTNWFVAVKQVEQVRNSLNDINVIAKDVKLEAIRSTGPGGQHVNKTNSAVRLTHIPTGIKLRVDTDRSQHRNRKLALERLQQILIKARDAKRESVEQERWLSHHHVKRGNPQRIFVGVEFKEIGGEK